MIAAAGDTFRAAATEQLRHWGERVGFDVIAHQQGSDPAAVAFDAIEAARARGHDLVLVDTAGRLHNKQNLMNELAKIRRVIERQLGRGPDEVALVLDATTGQNGLAQARAFTEAIEVTSVILTKLDGSARGGIVFAVASELGLPVRFIGVGDGPADLAPFGRGVVRGRPAGVRDRAGLADRRRVRGTHLVPRAGADRRRGPAAGDAAVRPAALPRRLLRAPAGAAACRADRLAHLGHDRDSLRQRPRGGGARRALRLVGVAGPGESRSGCARSGRLAAGCSPERRSSSWCS